MTPAGRRPGKSGTRDDIVQAARLIFADSGYDGTSLRAVARQAGVDPALVHHYFDGKAALFMAAMALPFDPRMVHARVATNGTDSPPGALIVEGFLTMWDLAEGTGSSFAACVGAMASSPEVADAMREFISERVWQQIGPTEGDDEEMAQIRVSLVATQLTGLAFGRYVFRVPPVSTATPADIAGWAGPTLDRYMKESLAAQT